VFVSHDSRDADLAEAFGNLLTDASGGMLDSFRSSDRKGDHGIDFGDEWYRAITEKLGGATDVVALLTASSINRPWILYEAGYAAAKLDTRVFGIAIGIPLSRTQEGPFGQFQNSADDEDTLTNVVLQLIRRNPEARPRDEAVRRQVVAFRETVGRIAETGGVAAQGEAPPVDENAVAKLFEEVKVMIRDLPVQMRDRRRFHPMMLEKMDMMLRDGPLAGEDLGPGIAWLMYISVFRDECSWLYELGMEVYEALRAGDDEAARSATSRMQHVAEVTLHGPLEMMMGGRDLHMMCRHLPERIDQLLRRSVQSSPAGGGRPGRRTRKAADPS
jgi:hypothetical protein